MAGMTESESFTLQCSKCGKELRLDAAFCPYCGRWVQPSATLSVVQAQTTGPLPPDQPAEKTTGPLPPDQPVEKTTGPLPPEQLIEKTTGPLSPEHLIEKTTGPLPSPGLPLPPSPRPPLSRAYRLRHAFWISLLAVCIMAFLFGAFLLDKNAPVQQIVPSVQWTPLAITALPPATALPEQRQVRIEIADTGLFGLITADGDLPADVQNKRLIFDPKSGSGNLVASIDGQTYLLGKRDLGQYVKAMKAEAPITWQWQQGNVVITQTLDVVLGGDGAGNLLRVAYLLDNQDSQSHQVGLRLLLDTRIGDNDGVPFLIPGQPGITDQAIDLRGEQVPSVIQALEQDDLANPGVITSLVLQGADAILPDRVVISGWPGSTQEWDYLDKAGGPGAPLRKAGQPDGEPDSAIGLYYDSQALAPGESREVVFYYGLGSLSSAISGNPKIGLFGPTKVLEGEQFYLSAVIADPVGTESVRLELPNERRWNSVRLTPGESLEKPVNGAGQSALAPPYTQISWLIQACRRGEDVPLIVYLMPGNSRSETWSLTIEAVGITRPGGVCP